MTKNNTLQGLFDIEAFCKELDFLTNPAIEENMVCSLDCCMANFVFGTLFEKLKKNVTISNIIGNKGLQLLAQLDESVLNGILDENNTAEGFSKTTDWEIFITLVNQVNTHLKKSIAPYRNELKGHVNNNEN